MNEFMLYRFWNDCSGLLYIGRTTNLPNRLIDHREGKDWWPLIDTITIERLDTAEELAFAERQAIASENPIYNRTGSLRAEIANIARKIDRAYGNPPGRALRGIYFWYWPWWDPHSQERLEILRDDALRFLDVALGIISEADYQVLEDAAYAARRLSNS